MPIDRPRRDALSVILLQHLRGELPPHDCWKQALPILEEFHRLSRAPTKENPRGFPALLPGDHTPQCLDDPIINPHISRALTAGLFSNNSKTRQPEHRWAILTRTLALLRSNVDATDLAHPRRRQFKPFARTLLACISVLMLIATILAALLLHPACLIAWPIFGVILLWKNQFLLKPIPRENPDAYPLLTSDQWLSIAHLVAPGDVLPFDPNRYPRRKPDPSKWRLLKILLLPLALIPLAMAAVVALLVMILVTVVWPLFLLDILNKAVRNSDSRGPSD